MFSYMVWCECMDRDQFKSLVVKMYRSYVQEDSALAASTKASAQDKKINMEDPQQAILTYITLHATNHACIHEIFINVCMCGHTYRCSIATESSWSALWTLYGAAQRRTLWPPRETWAR